MPEAGAAVFGRELELASLQRVLEHVVNTGEPRVALVAGPPGIGKSSLMGWLTRAARDRGMRVFVGRGEPHSSDRPFGALLDAFDIYRGRTREDSARKAVIDLLDAGVTLAPSLVGVTVSDVRARLASALADVAEHEAASGPIVVAIEDLHWCDPSCAATLRAITDRAAPIAIVVTTRPPVTPRARATIDLLASVDVDRIGVAPLDLSASLTLVRTLLGGTPGPRLATLVRRAAGNPLLLRTLADALEAEGRLMRSVEAGTVEVDSTTPPRTLSAHVQHLLGAVSEETRELLRLAAVLGPRFAVNDLTDAARLAPLRVAGAVDEAIAGGLVVADADVLAFRHELVRDSIYDSIPTAVRRLIHRDVARALAERGFPVLAIARHFALGADPGDAEAVAWIRRAAAEAVRFAPSSAVDLLDTALGLATAGTPDHADLLADRVEALGFAGRLADAELAAVDAVRALTDPARIASVERLRALALLLRNRCAEAAAMLVRLAGGTGESAEVGCLAEASLAALGSGDLLQGERLATEALERAADDEGARSLALTVLARIASLRGEFDLMFELSLRSLDAADRAVDRLGHRHLPLFFHAMALFDADRFAECHQTIAAGRQLCEQQGVAFAAPLHDALSAFLHLREGDVDGCAAEAASGVAACEETGLDVALVMCLSLVALASLHRGDVTAARAAVARASSIVDDRPPWLGYDLAVLARARLAEVDHGAARGLTELWPAFELLESLGALTMTATLAPDVVRLAAMAGHEREAHRAAAALAAVDAAAPQPGWRANAAVALSRVSSDAADARRAVDLFRDSQRRLELAGALEVLAALDPSAAGVALTEAMSVYAAAGATADAARVAAAGRALGIAGLQRPVDGEGPEQLTPTEAHVARLVGEGLSNNEIAARLFIGRRTVETHLRRVYAKLAVRSRRDLVAWARRRDESG